MKKLLLMLIGFLLTWQVQARDYDISPSPILGYSTNLGFVLGGAVFIFPHKGSGAQQYFDTKVYGATKGGFALKMKYENWGLPAGLSFEIQPVYNSFDFVDYGLGNQTQLEDLTRISSEFYGLLASLAKDFGWFKAGLGVDYAHYELSGTLPDYLPSTYEAYPLFVKVSKDERDDTINPAQGYFAQVKSTFFDNQAWSIEADFRHFLPFKSQWQWAQLVALGQQYGQVNTLAQFTLGGPDALRGVSGNRYRGTDKFLVQEELRYGMGGYIGYVAFASLGTVDFKDTLHYTYGAGMRFGLPPGGRMKIRLDYGMDELGDANFYVQFGHAF